MLMMSLVLLLSFSSLFLLAFSAKRYTRTGLTYFPTSFPAGVKTVDWSEALDVITFAQIPLVPPFTYYKVHTIHPDGTGEFCVTCNMPEIPKHSGNPAWSPDGEWILFSAQNGTVPDEYDFSCRPGIGVYNDIWVVRPDRSGLTQLTNYGGYNPMQDWPAILHPHFSHDGTKIFWAYRARPGDGFNGGWILRVGDWVDADPPRLENVVDYEIGDQDGFRESHSFSPDDSKIMFTGNLETGQIASGMDLYTYDLTTTDLVQLTDSPTDWDELAHYTNDGEKIIWMSAKDLGIVITNQQCNAELYLEYLKSELWIMDSDGSNKERLTGFNFPGHEDYDIYGGAQVVVIDSASSPSGEQAVVFLVYNDTMAGYKKGALYMMDFEVVEESVASIRTSSLMLSVVLLSFFVFGW